MLTNFLLRSSTHTRALAACIFQTKQLPKYFSHKRTTKSERKMAKLVVNPEPLPKEPPMYTLLKTLAKPKKGRKQRAKEVEEFSKALKESQAHAVSRPKKIHKEISAAP